MAFSYCLWWFTDEGLNWTIALEFTVKNREKYTGLFGFVYLSLFIDVSFVRPIERVYENSLRKFS